MVFFEYDAEAEKRVIYKDGVEEGRAKEIVRSCNCLLYTSPSPRDTR